MPGHLLSVAVAEDQPLLRMGIAQVLTIAGYRIASQTSDGPGTLQNVRTLLPRVLLIKKDLPGQDGVRCAQELKAEFGGKLGIIMLLSSPEDIWEALASGANGYALRETNVDLLPHAVKQVDAGNGWIGPNIAHYLLMGRGLPILHSAASRISHTSCLRQLSRREQDVIRLLVEGFSNQQIADSLGLKIQTVKVHVKSILRKLNAESRVQAVALILKSAV